MPRCPALAGSGVCTSKLITIGFCPSLTTTEHFHVVIVDYELPDMTGAQVAQTNPVLRSIGSDIIDARCSGSAAATFARAPLT